MESIRESIELLLENMICKNNEIFDKFSDEFVICANESIDDYTDIFQNALNEHKVVIIPSKSTPYVLKSSVVIPSNRKIIAKKGILL